MKSSLRGSRARKVEAPSEPEATKTPQPLDPIALEPTELRELLRGALSALTAAEFSVMRESLVAALKRSGVNVGAFLLLLGIPARSTEELTPSDVAHLVRYLRMNSPQAMESVSGLIAEILTGTSDARSASSRRLAA